MLQKNKLNTIIFSWLLFTPFWCSLFYHPQTLLPNQWTSPASSPNKLSQSQHPRQVPRSFDGVSCNGRWKWNRRHERYRISRLRELHLKRAGGGGRQSQEDNRQAAQFQSRYRELVISLTSDGITRRDSIETTLVKGWKGALQVGAEHANLEC